MTSNGSSSFGEAMRFLYAGRATEALRIGERLLADPDASRKLSGHLCLGLVLEEGGSGVAQDLDAALVHYAEATAMAGGSLTSCYQARATMKKGPEYYDSAIEFLEKAQALGDDPEVLLGFAHYYRTKPNPQIELAKRFYLRAALRGRFAGFMGYSEVSRQVGQRGRALAMDIVRVSCGPFLTIFLGGAANDVF